jgi:hypothetical protein
MIGRPQPWPSLAPSKLRAWGACLAGCLAVSGCGSSSSTTSTVSTPSRPIAGGGQATDPCSPPITRDGQPAVVVVLLDGVGSSEDGGKYYPLPLNTSVSGLPIVRNYCPLDSRFSERAAPDLPPGLDDSLRRWSEFSAPGGSSGSAPSVSMTCDRGDGFGQGTCLTEALADAGAVLLPYSYTGARIVPSGAQRGLFDKTAYKNSDSKQPICSAVKALADEIGSIHQAWPRSRIILVGHSYGGLVAETWWYDEQPSNGGHCVPPSGLTGVSHVFALDSPINGVNHCTLARAGPAAGAAANTWCDLWGTDHGVSNGKAIAAIDDTQLTFTAVGTPNDPTYGYNATGGGGGLFAQLVYRCVENTTENNGDNRCIDRTGNPFPVSYPSNAHKCDGQSGNIYGSKEHDLVKACPPVIRMIVAAVTAAAATQSTTLTGTFGAPATTNAGHQVDVTVTDPQHPAGDPSATGTVTVLYDGQQQIGSTRVLNGHAHIVTTAGDPGQGFVSATYTGDLTHTPSSVCLYGTGTGPCAHGTSAPAQQPSTTTQSSSLGCPGAACGTANGVTVIITSVRRSPTNNYGEDLTAKGQFFARMGVRVKNDGPQTITVDNAHFGLLDSQHIVDYTSSEGYESKCGLSGNGDPGLTLANSADITMPESLCFEPHGSVNSGFTVALSLGGGNEVDVLVH